MKTRETFGDELDIKNAINKLNEELKMVIALYYYEDLSVEEIAKTLGVPEGTVKSRLFRAREILYNYLSKEDVG